MHAMTKTMACIEPVQIKAAYDKFGQCLEAIIANEDGYVE